MADHSTIEWTDASWNPIVGCSVVSPGCINCYAMKRVAPRLAKNPATPHYAGTVEPSKNGPVFNGVVNRASDKVLTAPLTWSKPRMIFVNSTGDLFHENVPDEWIDRVFAVMALAPQHTFQVLTKRSARMREYVTKPQTCIRIVHASRGMDPDRDLNHEQLQRAMWPLPNVWLGVSAERQQEANERVPDLLATPAHVRFVSAEPLLGPIDFTNIDGKVPEYGTAKAHGTDTLTPFNRQLRPQLDWIIVGGESGSGARPMHPDWARRIRDDCERAGVPFFFKQWGEWLPGEFGPPPELRWQGNGPIHDANQFPADFDHEPKWDDGLSYCDEAEQAFFYKIGKKRAGRLLDGVEHNGMPEAREVPAL